MAITSLPPGFRFHPTDVELVMFYLKRKVLGKRFPIEAIAEVDIYKFPPWDLQGKACLSRDLKWYFFCPRGRKYATGARTNRSTDFGFWKTTGNDRPVIYKDEPVGMIKSLIFHRRLGGERKSERTDWVMHEYRLEDEGLKTQGVAQDAFVLCVIYQKDGPGPKNGAQYGAPFDEEEWEDDGEADVPSVSAFTQAFILPDKQKHYAGIRITDPERYCVESTSKACPAGPSQMVPSVVNVPPPAPTNDVTMEGPQNPCDEYLLSHGIFGDDIPAAFSENDKVENPDHVNPDGIHEAEFTMDDIFDGLEDLPDSLAPSHHLNNFADTNSNANMFPLSEPYLELNDFNAALTSVDAGPSGRNHSERYLSANDHSIAAQGFWTPVIPDENAPGLGLIDLESPLTFSGEAGQSNQAYVDAFSALGGSDGLGGFGTISNSPAFAQPFHGSEVTQVTEDFPQSSRYPRLEPMEGHVDMHWEGHGVGECTNQEIVRYGAGAANSAINNPDLGCAHACENPGRGLAVWNNLDELCHGWMEEAWGEVPEARP
ncbi:NAC domain-containing protein 82-like isoform X1 [Syzygium oleosum]|uniref:NAC domain-containing protein 82-like isoform X1 n=1 Tax=Syzygium oleosum TaxID=219896 RepID=UPI0024BA2E7E|nr:NAC domain-containing protein 82-like isoform X1 [Syzygium oleosum]